jgi:hypothetical protein
MSLDDMKELAKMYSNDVNSESIASSIIREVEEQLHVPPPPTAAEDEAELASADAMAKVEEQQFGVPSMSAGVAEKGGKGKKGKTASAAISAAAEATNRIESVDENIIRDSPAASLSSPPSSASASVSVSASASASTSASPPSSPSPSVSSPPPSSSSSSSSSMSTGLEDISSVFEWDGASKRAKLRLAKAIDEELMTVYTGLTCPVCSLPVEQKELDDHGKCYLCRGAELREVRVVEEEVAVVPSRRAEYEKRRAALAQARGTPYSSDSPSVAVVSEGSAVGPGPVLTAELDAQGVYTTSADADRRSSPITDAMSESAVAGQIHPFVYEKLRDLAFRMENTELSLELAFQEIDNLLDDSDVLEKRLDGVIRVVGEVQEGVEKSAMEDRVKELETRVEQLETLLFEKFGAFE